MITVQIIFINMFNVSRINKLIEILCHSSAYSKYNIKLYVFIYKYICSLLFDILFHRQTLVVYLTF